MNLPKQISSFSNLNKREFAGRYVFIAALFIVVCLVYITRLINVQITGQDYYATLSSVSDEYTRTVKIAAHRGSILDRNGTVLVTNTYTYSLYIDYDATPTNALKNDAVLGVLDNAAAAGVSQKLPSPDTPFSGNYPDMYYNEYYLNDSEHEAKYKKLLGALAYDEDIEPEKLLSRLLYFFRLTDSQGNPNYTDKQIDTLFAYRYDMVASGFDAATPYVMLEDIDIATMTVFAEKPVRGAEITSSAQRVYNYPGIASHILGRTGKIQSYNVEYYTEKGYPMDAIVGIDGAELAFEEYLHGTDGELTIVEDSFGNVLDSYVSVEPVAGKNVWLTIDLELQTAAENALADNIAYIAQKGAEDDEEYTGEDADAGSLSAVSQATGEVLALASYPTFDLSLFSESFEQLNSDPVAPMYNRALFGQYPPGSTFKLATAAAALSEGVIDENTVINDTGIYMYYQSSGFTPRCWIYLKYGIGHGPLDVTEAIQVSCNYFFFDVGRQLGIEKLNEYCKKLGLGQPTGIELNESTGVLAGPEYRENGGGEKWAPGDTLQAAIGQSDNLFTPLQMSAYMGALVNGGERMKSHLLYMVTDFYTNVSVYAPAPEVASSIDLSVKNHTLLMNALKSVTENGSAARVFADYPIIVGGKTGTAQVGQNRSDNAIFTAFAPFDAPEITVTCVIEKGANGTDAGFAVRGVFDEYFGLNNDTDGDVTTADDTEAAQ